MTDRASVFQVSQIGRETVPGTLVPATTVLAGMSIEPAVAIDLETYAPMGFKYDTISAKNREWTAAPVRGRPTYDELGIVLAGIMCLPVTTTPGGGSASRQHIFTPKVTRKDTVRTYSVENGDGYGGSDRFAHGLFTNLNLQFSRTGGNSLEGQMIGQLFQVDQPLTGNEVVTVTPASFTATAGTYTLTFGAQTTTGIPWNAGAATIQAALEALSSIGPGNVYVTGGGFQSGGSPIVIEFRGSLSQTDVGLVTGTGTGLTPSLALTAVVTTAGSVPTLLPQIPILPSEVDVFLDDTAAGLGVTKLTRDFVFSLQFGDRFNPIWPLNTSKPSWDGFVETKPRAQAQLTVANDEVGRALYNTMRLGSSKFCRCLATGPIIEGVIANKAQFDICLKVASAPDRSDLEGLQTLQWTFSFAYDPTWNKAWEALLINRQTVY